MCFADDEDNKWTATEVTLYRKVLSDSRKVLKKRELKKNLTQIKIMSRDDNQLYMRNNEIRSRKNHQIKIGQENEQTEIDMTNRLSRQPWTGWNMFLKT